MFGGLLQKVKNSVRNTARNTVSQEPFQKADLAEVDQELANPDRGWFQIFPFVLGEESGLETVESCLLPYERLALVIIDIRKYAEMELPEEALEQMREILRFFVERHKDIILRVAYDREGKAMEREPSLFQKVSRHMEQVAVVTAQFGEAVFVYQGLLIGNWGEMHGSRYLDEQHMASLAALLRDRLRGEVFLAVRTPAQWRLMEQGGQAGKALRMGLFNDAILGSETDRGTYSLDPKLREEDLLLVERIAGQTPSGGEVVLGEGYLDALTQEEILWRLSQMHLTYLNRQHDIQVIEKWRNTPYKGKGIFDGKSFYDYVGAHLGYRFHVQDVWMEAGAEGAAKLHLRLRNLGFASIYRQTQSMVLWENSAGVRGSFPISLNLRMITAGKTQEYVFPIALQTDVSTGLDKEMAHPCKFWLLTKRASDGEVIRFANRQTEDGSVLLGEW